MNDDCKTHWQEVYAARTADQVSWTEPKPAHSLALIRNTQIPKNSPIIDIGGGDSLLAAYLLEEGYSDITVLDISAKAIGRAKKRLGRKSEKISWLVTDMLDFKPERDFSIWHDRAAFHFLTTSEQKEKYRSIVENAMVNGHLMLGTFSLTGPEKCSGLPVCRYDAAALAEVFKGSFQMKAHFYADHITPFQTIQNFLFSNFIRINKS
jgi:2-polyprenyl-3-methyl-5-hydroxy-6-metoxy-1,4-benzoquinol methylase